MHRSNMQPLFDHLVSAGAQWRWHRRREGNTYFNRPTLFVFAIRAPRAVGLYNNNADVHVRPTGNSRTAFIRRLRKARSGLLSVSVARLECWLALAFEGRYEQHSTVVASFVVLSPSVWCLRFWHFYGRDRAPSDYRKPAPFSPIHSPRCAVGRGQRAN